MTKSIPTNLTFPMKRYIKPCWINSPLHSCMTTWMNTPMTFPIWSHSLHAPPHALRTCTTTHSTTWSRCRKRHVHTGWRCRCSWTMWCRMCSMCLLCHHWRCRRLQTRDVSCLLILRNRAVRTWGCRLVINCIRWMWVIQSWVSWAKIWSTLVVNKVFIGCLFMLNLKILWVRI